MSEKSKYVIIYIIIATVICTIVTIASIQETLQTRFRESFQKVTR